MPFSAPPADSPSPAYAARAAPRHAALAAALATLYPKPASIVFEIGCGHGHLLAAYASVHPETYCLGVDLVTKRVERALRKQKRLNLKNLAFLKADAAETLAALPSHVRLKGIFVLFPDPWPKQRHQRRRLLQISLLEALATRANTGSWLAARTDDSKLMDWIKSQIINSLQFNISLDYPWPFEYPTYFQDLKGSHQSIVAIKR